MLRGKTLLPRRKSKMLRGKTLLPWRKSEVPCGKSLFPWRNQAKSSREIAFPHWRNDSQAGILKHAPYLIGDPFPVTICPQPELRLMSIEKEILEIGEQVTEKEEQCFDIGNRGISKKRLHGKMVRYDTVPKHLVTDRRVQIGRASCRERV